MEARIKLLGHPVHTMVVMMPLGLLLGAVIFDIVHMATPEAVWGIVSFWTMGLGLLSGLFAAVFGIADWTKIPPGTRARRIGTLHGVGNTFAMLLFAWSWLLRAGTEAMPGGFALVLSFAGAGILLIAGWLGGELVDRLGVGVDEGAHVDAPSSLSGRPAASEVGRERPAA